jgi:hypothetical protein
MIDFSFSVPERCLWYGGGLLWLAVSTLAARIAYRRSDICAEDNAFVTFLFWPVLLAVAVPFALIYWFITAGIKKGE